MQVGEIMTRDVVAVGGEATLTEAAELMRKHNVGFLPVVTADVVVGVVSDRDIVVRGIGEGRNPYLTLVRSVMSATPIWCYDDDVLTDVADILAKNHVRRLVVVDKNNKLAGLISIDDIALYMSSDRLLSDLMRHVAAV